MAARAVTFTDDVHVVGNAVGAADAVGALVGAGCEIGPVHEVSITLLDTFDRRLRSAGLRLEFGVTDERTLELVLSADDSPTVSAVVGSPPRFASDLDGPLRARLAPVVDVRALLGVAMVRGKRRRAELRNDDGKVVAWANLWEQLSFAPAAGIESAPAPDRAVEVFQATGHPRDAEYLRRVLDKYGYRRRLGDLLGLAEVAAAAAAVGVLQAAPALPGRGLHPDQSAISGFVVVLTDLLDAIEVNWQGTIDDLDTEFLHDLRVAVRRTRSVLSEGRRVLASEQRRVSRDQFRWLGEVTGPCRDLDVLLLEWDGYLAPLDESTRADLAPVLARVTVDRQRAHDDLVAAFTSSRATSMLDGWRDWLAEAVGDTDADSEADNELGLVVARRIVRAQRRLIDQGREITDESPAALLHELRKDAKKLRYLFECFDALLPSRPRKALVRRLKVLQDNLGEHQDTEVHALRLGELADSLRTAEGDIASWVAARELMAELDRRRHAARLAFADRFAAYDTPEVHAVMRELIEEIAR